MAKERIIDRRIIPRYVSDIDAEVISSIDSGGGQAYAKILNASEYGILLASKQPFIIGQNLGLSFPMPMTKTPIQVAVKVIWSSQNNSIDNLAGVQLSEPLLSKNDWNKFIGGLSAVSHQIERRDSTSSDHFFVRNRKEDYEQEYERSPYNSFLSSLRKLKDEGRYENIIISDSLNYLKKKIRSVFGDDPKIISADNLLANLVGPTLVIVNLESRRKHESFTFLDFEEYLLKCRGVAEPLKTLQAVGRNTKEGESVTFLSLGHIQNQEIAFKYLHVARFEQCQTDGSNVIVGTKRSLLHREILEGNFILHEVQSKSDIDKIQNFSSKYYEKSFNFNKDIDDLFTSYSHFYAILKASTGETLTCARVTWHFPNHYMPCMLAHKQGTDLHLQIQSPNQISYGEIYAPYFNSFSSLKAYGDLVKRFYYYFDEKFIDVFLTTYSADQHKESKFLQKYLAFKETGITLKYGDFGGLWNLVYLTKKNFDDNIKFNFKSPEKSPHFVNAFRTK